MACEVIDYTLCPTVCVVRICAFSYGWKWILDILVVTLSYIHYRFDYTVTWICLACLFHLHQKVWSHATVTVPENRRILLLKYFPMFVSFALVREMQQFFFVLIYRIEQDNILGLYGLQTRLPTGSDSEVKVYISNKTRLAEPTRWNIKKLLTQLLDRASNMPSVTRDLKRVLQNSINTFVLYAICLPSSSSATRLGLSWNAYSYDRIWEQRPSVSIESRPVTGTNIA